MFKAPEAKFAAFVAACFLTGGLMIAFTESRPTALPEASVAKAVESDRRGARQTPAYDLRAAAPLDITGPRRGARAISDAAPTTLAQARAALSDTVSRDRRAI